MGSRLRPMRPGEPQARRASFCLKMLGVLVVLIFFSAILIGIPFQGVWDSYFVPVFVVTPFVLIFFTVVFTLRWLWFKAKAKHYETLLKMRTDPRFK